MLVGGGALLVVELCLLAYSVLSLLTSPKEDVRRLPKPLWLAIVVLLPLLGGIAYVLAGRPLGPSRAQQAPRRVAPPVHPDDDEAFLRGLRQRAEEQRRRAEEERRRGESGPEPV